MLSEKKISVKDDKRRVIINTTQKHQNKILCLCRSVYGTVRFILSSKSALCSAFLPNSTGIRVNLHRYHDFVAEGTLSVQSLIQCRLLLFKNHDFIDMLCG
jgi:hypothetical protein